MISNYSHEDQVKVYNGTSTANNISKNLRSSSHAPSYLDPFLQNKSDEAQKVGGEMLYNVAGLVSSKRIGSPSEADHNLLNNESSDEANPDNVEAYTQSIESENSKFQPTENTEEGSPGVPVQQINTLGISLLNEERRDEFVTSPHQL